MKLLIPRKVDNKYFLLVCSYILIRIIALNIISSFKYLIANPPNTPKPTTATKAAEIGVKTRRETIMAAATKPKKIIVNFCFIIDIF